MDWYYADDSNTQLGPIPEDELHRLVSAGNIRQDTLVWHDGMPDWAAYGQIQGATGGPAAAAAPEAPAVAAPSPLAVSAPMAPAASAVGASPVIGTGICRDCGQTFNNQDLMDFGGTLICANCKPLFLQRMREGGQLSGEMVYAGFWIRFGAKLIDGIITGIVGVIIMFLTMMPAAATENESTQIMGAVAYYVLAFGFSIFYYVWFHGTKGATPGKMACGIRVVTAEGAPITKGRAFGRYFGDLLSQLILSIGYLIAAFDAEKRALHDHICNTRVIRNL